MVGLPMNRECILILNSEVGAHTCPQVRLDMLRGWPVCVRRPENHPDRLRALAVFREARKTTRGARVLPG